MRAWWLAGPIVAALLVGAGCTREPADPAAPTRYRLQVSRAEIRTAAPLSAAEVRAALDDALRGSAVFDPAAAEDGARLDAHVRVLELQGPAAQPVLRYEIGVDPPPGFEAALGRNFEAVIEVEHHDGALVLAEDLPLASRRAVAVLEAKLALARDDQTAIVRLLDSDDPELIMLTLDFIETHRHRVFADQVAGLLKHRSEAVVLRALECLGRIGSPAHVPAMIEAVRLADRAQANRLYDAVARLGGPEAEAFLEFAARNEDDPALVEAAKRAWARVQGADVAEHEEARPLKRGHR